MGHLTQTSVAERHVRPDEAYGCYSLPKRDSFNQEHDKYLETFGSPILRCTRVQSGVPRGIRKMHDDAAACIRPRGESFSVFTFPKSTASLISRQ